MTSNCVFIAGLLNFVKAFKSKLFSFNIFYVSSQTIINQLAKKLVFVWSWFVCRVSQPFYGIFINFSNQKQFLTDFFCKFQKLITQISHHWIKNINAHFLTTSDYHPSENKFKNWTRIEKVLDTFCRSMVFNIMICIWIHLNNLKIRFVFFSSARLAVKYRRKFCRVGTKRFSVLKHSEIEYFKQIRTTLVLHFQCLGPVSAVEFWRKNTKYEIFSEKWWSVALICSSNEGGEKVWVPSDEYFCDNRRMCANNCDKSRHFS